MADKGCVYLLGPTPIIVSFSSVKKKDGKEQHIEVRQKLQKNKKKKRSFSNWVEFCPRFCRYFKTRKAYMVEESRDCPEKCGQNFGYVMEVTG